MKAEVKKNYHNIKSTKLNQKDTLLIAIGNSARSDDGLGWSFLEQLKKQGTFKGKTSVCYQLQIEDAEMISNYSRVVFVDACEEDISDGFAWEETIALNDFTFTTHALTPSAVLFLANDLYQKYPEAYTLKIKGLDWALKIGMSGVARENLAKAAGFFNGLITSEEEQGNGSTSKRK
jgi:hydrogenase maturation protease